MGKSVCSSAWSNKLLYIPLVVNRCFELVSELLAQAIRVGFVASHTHIRPQTVAPEQDSNMAAVSVFVAQYIWANDK